MLDNRELAELKQALESRERQLVSEIEAGRTQASREPFERLAGEAPDAGDASVADVAIDSATAERTRDSQELREVRAALARMEAGTYGSCLACGEPIPIERLRASPAARYDVKHQQAREEGISTPKL